MIDFATQEFTDAQAVLDDLVMARHTYPRAEYVALLNMLIGVVAKRRAAMARSLGWSLPIQFPY